MCIVSLCGLQYALFVKNHCIDDVTVSFKEILSANDEGELQSAELIQLAKDKVPVRADPLLYVVMASVYIQ